MTQGACWGAHSGALGNKSDGAIPGFGSNRVRAEKSYGFERAGILRGGRCEEDETEDGARAGLDTAFADVEKLEESLRKKAAS